MAKAKQQLETFMKPEGALGADVSTVSAHIGKVATDKTSKMSAAEFTLYNRFIDHPQSELVSHELVHTMNQKLEPVKPGAEAEAKSPEKIATPALVKRVVEELNRP